MTGQGQPSLQHLLYSSGGSTPSGQQGSSSINDLQPVVSSSLPTHHSSQAARALRPSHWMISSKQHADPPNLLTAIADLEPVGSWLDDDMDWQQRAQGPGAHGSHAANDPLLHLFPSQAPDATGSQSPSRPFSTLPLPLPDVPYGEELLDLHPSLSSPVIRLPGSFPPDLDDNLAGSRSMVQLDMLHEVPASAPRGAQGPFAGPPAAPRVPQGRGARVQRRTVSPGQGLMRATSAPVLRRGGAAGQHQLHPQHHLHSEGFEFSIECVA